MSSSGNVTQILQSWEHDREGALKELMPVVYHELRRLAASYLLRERPDHTLQPTALIHEAYLRLVRQDTPTWKDRAHFFGVAAQVMRQVLVDSARKHRAAKRGPGHKISIGEVASAPLEQCEVFLQLHDALEKLNEVDQRKCRVLELRYFGGMRREEIAEALGVSVGTIKRDLLLGEAWLRSAMGPPATRTPD